MPNYTSIISTHLGDMIVLNTDDAQGNYYPKHGRHIQQTQINDIVELVKSTGPNPVFLDVGANIGWFSFSVAKAIPSSKVITFEPQRIIYNCICGTIAINCIENIYAHNAAVGKELGSVQLPELNYSIPSNFGGVEFSEKNNKEKIGQPYKYNNHSVPLVTIDSLNLDKVDFIKIDVEGMEFDVLEGAKNTIEKHKPLLCLEFLKVSKKELEHKLDTLGYEYKKIAAHDYVCIHKSKIPT